MVQGKPLVFLTLLIMNLAAVNAKETPSDWVNVQQFEPSLYLDMAYATPHNFLKEAVYPHAVCLLHRPIAEALQRAQHNVLQQGYSLKLWDCYRPLSVQKKMWALVPDARYVADPKDGSRHNRGAAVDITLVTAQGKSLEMPTNFDDFSVQASPTSYARWSAPARKHFDILKQAMLAAGFDPLPSEWWHYDERGWRHYEISDFPLPKP